MYTFNTVSLYRGVRCGNIERSWNVCIVSLTRGSACQPLPTRALLLVYLIICYTLYFILLFQELSAKLDDDKSLSEHLKLPLQRINDYKLLFKVCIYLFEIYLLYSISCTCIHNTIDYLLCLSNNLLIY